MEIVEKFVQKNVMKFSICEDCSISTLLYFRDMSFEILMTRNSDKHLKNMKLLEKELGSVSITSCHIKQPQKSHVDTFGNSVFVQKDLGK